MADPTVEALRAALADANAIIAMTRQHLAKEHPDCAFEALGVMNDESRRLLAAGASSAEAHRRERGWPTPNHMRHAADALDMLVIPRYGDVLRWFADLCDAKPAEVGGSRHGVES